MTPADRYAGDLEPGEAYRLLEEERDAVLVDVRTRAEWTALLRAAGFAEPDFHAHGSTLVVRVDGAPALLIVLHAGPAPVAHGGAGDEHGHAICAADAAALGGHGGNLRFKQIIFLYHGKTSVKHKILFFMHKAENMRVI